MIFGCKFFFANIPYIKWKRFQINILMLLKQKLTNVALASGVAWLNKNSCVLKMRPICKIRPDTSCYFFSSDYLAIDNFEFLNVQENQLRYSEKFHYNQKTSNFKETNAQSKNLQSLNSSCNQRVIQKKNITQFDCDNHQFDIHEQNVKKNKSNEDLDVKIFIEKAQKMLAQQKSESALYYFQNALPQIEKIHGQKSIQVADILNSIGEIYLQLNNYQKSLQQFQKCLTILSEFSEKDIAQFSIMSSISTIYCQLQQNSLSIQYHLKALEIYQRSGKQQSMELGFAYNNAGNTYYAMKNYQKAIDSFNQCYKIQAKILGDVNINVSYILVNIGNIYQQINEHQEAVSFFREAASITQKYGEQKISDLAQIYESLAHNLYRSGQRAQALEIYYLLLEVKQSLSGEDSWCVAQTLQTISQILIQQQQYEMALTILNRCRIIEEQKTGKDSQVVGKSLFNTAYILMKTNKVSQAISMFLKANTIFSNTNTNNATKHLCQQYLRELL